MDVFAATLRLKEVGASAVSVAVGKLGKAANAATADMRKLDKSSTDFSGTLRNLAGSLAIGATIKKFADETSNAQSAQAELSATLRATGQSSRFTLKELNDQASALQNVTVYSDEAVNAAQSIILRYNAISKETFPRAIKSAADLAALMKTDMPQAAAVVGRALQSPEMAARLLRSANINLSQAQQDTIKSLVETGKKAEAQAIVFSELDRVSKGLAEAQRNTLGGAIKGLLNSFGDLFELTDQGASIFTVLINKVSDIFTEYKNNIQGFIANWLPKLLGAFTALAGAALIYKGALMGVAAWTAIAAGFETIKAFIALARAVRTAADAAALLSLAGGGWVKLVAGLVAIVGGVTAYAVATKKIDEMSAAAMKSLEDLQKTLGGAGAGGVEGALGDTTKAAVDQVAALIELAGITSITRTDMGVLAAEEHKLANALKASNLAYDKKLELTKRLQAVEEARKKATIRFTAEELASGAGGFGMAAAITPQSAFRIRRGMLGGEASLPPMKPVMDAFARDTKKVQAQSMALVDQAKLSVYDGLSQVAMELSNGIRDTFVEGIANGIQEAVATGNIGEGFKAFGRTILAGLGSVLIEVGKKVIVIANLFQGLQNALTTAITNPYALTAVGLAMIGVGAALRGVAQKAFGGPSSAQSSTPAMGGFMGAGMGRLPTMTFGPTMATAGGSLSPVAPMNVTIIGPNDPSAQRAMQELMTKANRRGGV